MAFSFGGSSQAQASPFGFGGAAASASSTPLFGAASTPAFGTPAAGFGSSAPAFGAASTPGFGAASTPGFGFSSSAMFGAASTPAFGATASPSPFGGASSAGMPSAATPFSFSAPASSAGFFQSTSAPSMFGASSAAASPFGFATATGGGMFGAQQLQQQQQQAPQQQAFPTTQMAPATFASSIPPQPDYSASKELMAIKDAYVPDSDKFRFNWLFLNVVDSPAARVKPPAVDDLRWREALKRAGGPDNPDHLWPVLALGFQDLLGRKNVQDGAMEEHNKRVEALMDMARQLARTQETVLQERLEGAKRRQLELTHSLLCLMRKLDAVESRFGATMAYREASDSREATLKLHTQLAQLEADVLPSSSASLQNRVENLSSAVHMRGGVAGGAYMLGNVEGSIHPASLEHMFGVLQQHTEALTRIKDVLRRDERDLSIMLAEEK